MSHMHVTQERHACTACFHDTLACDSHRYDARRTDTRYDNMLGMHAHHARMCARAAGRTCASTSWIVISLYSGSSDRTSCVACAPHGGLWHCTVYGANRSTDDHEAAHQHVGRLARLPRQHLQMQICTCACDRVPASERCVRVVRLARRSRIARERLLGVTSAMARSLASLVTCRVRLRTVCWSQQVAAAFSLFSLCHA